VISIGWGRASRDLTAIPVQAGPGRNRKRQCSGSSEAPGGEGGFVDPRGMPAAPRRQGKKPDRPAEGL